MLNVSNMMRPFKTIANIGYILKSQIYSNRDGTIALAISDTGIIRVHINKQVG